MRLISNKTGTAATATATATAAAIQRRHTIVLAAAIRRTTCIAPVYVTTMTAMMMIGLPLVSSACCFFGNWRSNDNNNVDHPNKITKSMTTKLMTTTTTTTTTNQQKMSALLIRSHSTLKSTNLLGGSKSFFSSSSSSSSASLSSSSSSILACSARHANTNNVKIGHNKNHETTTNVTIANQITRQQTPADIYFQKHHCLPRPKVVHMTLPVPSSTTSTSTAITTTTNNDQKKNILVIGDVHGCFDEMIQLYQKAVIEENDNLPFEYVILVGDMCNKGPQSIQVIQWVRTQPNWYTVRGNHDDAALQAALGDESKLSKPKYHWVARSYENDNNNNNNNNKNNNNDTGVGDENNQNRVLSNDDIMWMTELPYTITIPGSFLGEDTVDTIIVHAGFIPNVALEEQEIETMITLRNVLPKKVDKTTGKDDVLPLYEYCPKSMTKSNSFKNNTKDNNANTIQGDEEEAFVASPLPWASVWKGPQRVIFGHDAKRRLQTYDGNWALGIDTGAVYGNGMTGVILPQRKLLSIETKTHQRAGS